MKILTKEKFLPLMLVMLLAATMFALSPLSIKADETQTVSVLYYNEGFWQAMLTNNDFKNAFSSLEYNADNDTLRVNVDVPADTTAWGPANYISDEYCDWSLAKSLIVEVKNNTNSLADFRFFYSGYLTADNKTGANETHFAVGGGKTYYLRSKDGNVTENTVGIYSIGGVNIPGSFDGYIIIPVSELLGFWGGEVSLNCVKRINFQLSGEWSVGDVTFGKVGYATQEGAEVAANSLSFVPMCSVQPDENPNDLKVIKNWLYNLNITWLDAQIKANGNDNSITLSNTADELNLVYNTSKWTELWCDDFTAEDRNLSDYKYLILDIKNNTAQDAELGFMITNGVAGQTKYHYVFQNIFLRPSQSADNTMAKRAVIDGSHFTIPANFDGYVILELNPAKMADIYDFKGGTFTPENVGSMSFFLKAGITGNLTIRRPMVAKSNKILDSQYPINNIIDNDTKTVRFKLFGESKDYDGSPLQVEISEEFKDNCTITWFAVSGASEIPLSSAPVNAGLYKVKAKATNYNYEDELMLTINKANPVNLISFKERTYYAKETVTSLELADDSLSGTVNVTPVTLVLGENTINFQFVPESQNYKTINASIQVTAVKASPASLIKFKTKTYYVGQTVSQLELASDSLEGTVEVVSVKLIKGENNISYTFTPSDAEYETYQGVYVINAVEPQYTVTVNGKVDGKPVSVTVEGYPFEYTLKFYALRDGEYVEIDSAPSAVGKYKVVVFSEELGEGQSVEFEIKKKGCGSAQITAILSLLTLMYIALPKRKNVI